MNFRVKVTDPNGLWITQPFGNYIDAARYCKAASKVGHIAEIVVSGRRLDEECNTLWANVVAEQLKTGEPQVADVSAGCPCGLPGCVNPMQNVAAVRVPISGYTPANIVVPPAAKPVELPAELLGPVFGGWPLLDDDGAEWRAAVQRQSTGCPSDRLGNPSSEVPQGSLAAFWAGLLALIGDWLLGRPRLRLFPDNTVSPEAQAARNQGPGARSQSA